MPRDVDSVLVLSLVLEPIQERAVRSREIVT